MSTWEYKLSRQCRAPQTLSTPPPPPYVEFTETLFSWKIKFPAWLEGLNILFQVLLILTQSLELARVHISHGVSPTVLQLYPQLFVHARSLTQGFAQAVHIDVRLHVMFEQNTLQYQELCTQSEKSQDFFKTASNFSNDRGKKAPSHTRNPFLFAVDLIRASAHSSGTSAPSRTHARVHARGFIATPDPNSLRLVSTRRGEEGGHRRRCTPAPSDVWCRDMDPAPDTKPRGTQDALETNAQSK
ncbi:hypothetical protein DFH09DRAFT_1087584 [Mycena vulgaris]|nr:hypothetical protein DFH09DRAFT_1111057 [Mycena vulgaris]KAJ6500318.1 hypothetical protein DFH09DRAFT_1102744 [Mycena vulgaris]KAJ6547796.1 hypothetical protein DFH09DRAFT_1087545 [Mycena vulgaris]KAJ6547838.1 hypothetical protein DFH09DRAFT_1087584 [Mycena vulgaris]